MKAIVFDSAGEPEQVLRLGEVPEPEARGEELLVRVAARPIHPADLSFIRGHYRIRPSFPQVAGLEGAGVVLDRGATAPFAPDTRVAFRWPGAWGEVVAVPRHRLIPVPDEVSDAVACQFSLNPLTAWALLDEAEVKAGEWVLMTAGASTVSSLVAAVAQARGRPFDRSRPRSRCNGGCANARRSRAFRRRSPVARQDLRGRSRRRRGLAR